MKLHDGSVLTLVWSDLAKETAKSITTTNDKTEVLFMFFMLISLDDDKVDNVLISWEKESTLALWSEKNATFYRYSHQLLLLLLSK